jgi:hypothetical protein
MGNKRGTGPATSESPDYPAHTTKQSSDRPSDVLARLTLRPSAVIEVTKRHAPALAPEPFEDGVGAELEIDAEYQRRLAGLRRLPRHERAAALRLAREWRQLALRALREKRATARHAARSLRRLQRPQPA